LLRFGGYGFQNLSTFSFVLFYFILFYFILFIKTSKIGTRFPVIWPHTCTHTILQTIRVLTSTKNSQQVFGAVAEELFCLWKLIFCLNWFYFFTSLDRFLFFLKFFFIFIFALLSNQQKKEVSIIVLQLWWDNPRIWAWAYQRKRHHLRQINRTLPKNYF